ncbi:hypothetical protein T440DRAFT_507621 [Plenodomus tracheiphilus IPT5]|uniref:Uncharacterized protein n=1 Tax=Plenodomus tracheiphilus IPT5 TaxID=1408161 RepID=A0A6A7B934_9PLEO|nr:hypothetical protein T440DRAFT_507621 [Plenodomus tracheiphilus IPT5]
MVSFTYLIPFLCTQAAVAIAVPIAAPAAPQDTVPVVTSKRGWSKEAIITLVGVLATITCFGIGLAWPYIRSLLRRLLPVDYCQADGAAAEYPLVHLSEGVRRYNDFLKFNAAWQRSRRERV